MHAKKTIKKPVITNYAIYTQTQNDTIDGDWNWVRNKKQTENPDPGNPDNYYESTLSSNYNSVGCLGFLRHLFANPMVIHSVTAVYRNPNYFG
ncbi:hypothetical protein SSYM_1219 [Serratia symbiotica str. Tucson]|uniref:Uncharacterized protein n=1 Tax=Serratia symbiotica str. Tucson TaxID=914128 RepID=E9CLT0_9GAMM|nr:hypothetical protein [Serratia symbiotica]EFW12592.1 hypothetical protein SSYM_1219 [Serratia symbiotica str. Tucson]